MLGVRPLIICFYPIAITVEVCRHVLVNFSYMKLRKILLDSRVVKFGLAERYAAMSKLIYVEHVFRLLSLFLKYCSMLGILARFCPIIVQVTPLKTPFGLVTPFITIPITRSCSHTQLLITPLHNYNPCAFVPTITYCTVTLLTIDSVFSVFDSSARLVLLLPTADCCLRRLARSLCLRNSCPKVGTCGRYSEHLVPRFVSAVYELVT
jgi:hypothetical protein